MNALRTLIFFLLLTLWCLFWLPVTLLFGLVLPYRQRYRLIAVCWSKVTLWLARFVLGIRYRITGLENIPQQPCVILAKHQSAWETFFLSAQFYPLSQVLKRELLNIPVFGWALRTVKPIAINREQPKQALRQLAEQGAERLGRGNWLLIFPEGTRLPPGQLGKFSRGGAQLAARAGLPVLPVTHNAGRCWPKTDWRKSPGIIDVVIGPPIYPDGNDSAAIARLNQQAYLWVARAQHALGELDPEVWEKISSEAEAASMTAD